MGFLSQKLGPVCIALAIVFGYASESMAAPGQRLELDQEARMSPVAPPLQLRNRGGDEIPKAGSSLEVKSFAKSLGKISAMVMGAKDEIYTLDQEAGRLFILTDRDLDGRMDVRRVLSSDFNQPTGMVYTDEGLYVSDADGIWHLDLRTYKTRQFVSLANIPALFAPRPMILSEDETQLILGLSFADGTARLITIDRASGKASELSRGPGPLTAMAQIKGSSIWLGIGHHLVPILGESFSKEQGMALEPGASIENLYLPTASDMISPGLKHLAGQFLIVQGGDKQLGKKSTGGRNIVAVPNSFGTPQSHMKVIIDGFISNHGRSAWGQPKAIVWDKRGLFMADQKNGIIWKISKWEPKITFINASETEDLKLYKDDVVKKPKAKWGSSITQASSIMTGSEISKKWEEDKIIPDETLMEKIRREEAKETEAED